MWTYIFILTLQRQRYVISGVFNIFIPYKIKIYSIKCSYRRHLMLLLIISGLPVSSLVKNPPANSRDAGDMGLIPGSGRSPGGGNGNPLQYSCLENSMDRGAWRLQSMWSQRVGHNLVTEHTLIISTNSLSSLFLYHFLPFALTFLALILLLLKNIHYDSSSPRKFLGCYSILFPQLKF